MDSKAQSPQVGATTWPSQCKLFLCLVIERQHQSLSAWALRLKLMRHCSAVRSAPPETQRIPLVRRTSVASSEAFGNAFLGTRPFSFQTTYLDIARLDWKFDKVVML